MAHRQALGTGSVVGEDYVIERVLGQGGFGITYLARDKSLGIQVAIKEYFPAALAYRDAGITVHAISDKDEASYNWGLERFLAEARTLARLRHPNIVRVSRYFKENGTAYMVLGFVVGQDLESWLRSLGRKPKQKELDDIVRPLLDALTVVHGADIVHRDIKPANIYIQKSDGAPILLDFGAARQALGEQTRATAAFVSPGYSPPESHLNDPAKQGPWTDIYGLAATLYRAVVGKAPEQVVNRLNDDKDLRVAEQISNAGDYRPGFLAAIDRGMKLRREERPQSVAAWRTMLFSTLADEDTVVHGAGDDATVIKGGDQTVIKTRPASNQPDTVVRAPVDAWSANTRRIVAGGIALVALAALYYIYSSFEQGLQNAPPGQTARPAPAQTQPVPSNFIPYENARFGYTFSYPPQVLIAQPAPQNGAGQSFQTADGTFQVNSFASFNSDGSTSQQHQQELQANDSRFANARVTSSGEDGFSLLANDGNRINAYLAVLTCNAQIINVLDLSLPASNASYRDIANRIIGTFRPGVGEDTPPECTGSGANANEQANEQANLQPLPEPTPAPVPAPTPAPDNLPFPQTNDIFSDPSLRRLAVYGWSAAGIQNGLWTAGMNSNAGSLLNIKCSAGSGARRSGLIELQMSGLSLSGDHQVNAFIGDYIDGGVLTFTPNEGGTIGTLQISETDETAGNYLRFLQAVAAGQSLVLQIPDANIQDEFSLFEAGQALGPCLGQSMALPWFDDGERDGVIGTGVRNDDGGAFYFRCDTSPQTRGNVLLAFAGRQRRGIANPQTATIKAFVGTRFNDLEFILAPEPDVVTGFIYHVNEQGSADIIGQFLELLSGGNQLRLLNTELGIDETFSLSGSRNALQGCASLY